VPLRGDGAGDDERRNRRHRQSDLLEENIADYEDQAVMIDGRGDCVRHGFSAVRET
jgi:hypothetical protein